VSAGWNYFDADEVGFKELYQLFSLATNQLDQKPASLLMLMTFSNSRVYILQFLTLSLVNQTSHA